MQEDKMKFNQLFTLERMLSVKMPLIFFLFFGIINILLFGGCGGSKKDNRVVLHSEFADYLLIKDGSVGYLIGGKISKSQLAVALAKRVSSVSEIYDISDELGGSWINNNWYILFTVRTVSGKVYTGLKCDAYVKDAFVIKDPPSLQLEDCGTGEENGVRFGDDFIEIPLKEILVKGDQSILN